jgi:hypothetical protein
MGADLQANLGCRVDPSGPPPEGAANCGKIVLAL